MLKPLFILFIFLFAAIFNTDSTKISIVHDSLQAPDENLLVKSTTDSSQSDDSLFIPISEAELVYPSVENNAFHVGEKLTFKVRYGFVRAGTATMSVVSKKIINDKLVYQIQTTAESDAPFSWVYEVNDVVTSLMDAKGLFTWRFEKKLREGGYEIDHLVDYLPEDSLAKVKNIRYRDEGNEESTYDVKVPPFAKDVLASFYYIRTQPLRVGDIISMTNHDNKKFYDLEVHVYMRETVNTAAGEFKCLKIEPLLKGEGIFQQKGRLLVWVTNDEYKIPVQMTSEITVGHITVDLEKIEGIKGKIPSQISD